MPTTTPVPDSSDQQAQADRAALERSEKKAAGKQPGSYKDKATEEKQVEIGPDLTNHPIKGIDPADEVKKQV
jgi:hypothetical protein